ncbi:restriction endonuclease subunit S [Bradyrhizobium sp. CCBAU 45321]|uniref:restriction endonuclease subunit S n=1 Tax=Bradyrhizobium sp. CCBAU 45321 TaxID=1641878 RepID=UPI002302A1A9|nr:restriction endonuclease subunit S [Bradyrhizobium sp. CCBAU 45321]
MSDLPNGWTRAAIGEIADVRLGKMLDAAKNKGTPVPYLRNVNVRWGSFDLADILEMRMTAEELESYSIKDGDVIICEGGEPGRAAVWRSGPTELKFQKALHRARTFNGVSPEWLAFYMRHIATNGELESRFTGTTIKHLPLATMREMPMPLPPIPEQRRIVTKIDSLSAKSRRARHHLDHIARLVEKYKQAILNAGFSQAGGHGDYVPLAGAIASTFYGPRFAKEAYGGEGVVTLRTTDFDDHGNVRLKSPPRVTVSAAELAKWGLVEGDLLVTRTGSIGKCALYSQSIGPALPSAYLIRVRLRIERVRPRYVLLFLLSNSGQEQLGLGITAVTQPNINAGVIERLTLPIPDLDRQDRVIHYIEKAFAWINRLASEATSARKLVDHLDRAVLAKAFRGELVPQASSDEPASVLLDRIRAERRAAASAGGDGKRRRKATA